MLLERYAAQLHAAPLPPDTTEIARDKAVGNLYGTGNHLDFAAMIEIESFLSESELFDYYSTNAKDIKSVEELSIFGMDVWYDRTLGDHSFQTIEVIPKNQARLAFGSSKIFVQTDNPEYDAAANVFIIQIKDTHYPAGWDIRAH